MGSVVLLSSVYLPFCFSSILHPATCTCNCVAHSWICCIPSKCWDVTFWYLRAALLIYTVIFGAARSKKGWDFLVSIVYRFWLHFHQQGPVGIQKKCWEKYFNKAMDSLWKEWTTCHDAFTMKQWISDAASSKGVHPYNELVKISNIQPRKTFPLYGIYF